MKRIKYLHVYILSFISWTTLLLMRMYEILPFNKISQITAHLALILHIFMLVVIIKIFSTASSGNRKIFFWLFSINVGLFLNDFVFYFIIYFSENYNFNISFISYVIDMIPYSIWNISVLVFLINLVRTILISKNFMKFFSILMLINLGIIFLFFASVPPAFHHLSWQNISQIITALTELFIYDLSMLCLIYSEETGLSFIVVGLVILISGDFIITYSFLAQTNAIATYGALFWVLGLLCILFGMLELKNQGSYTKNWLRSTNSIKGNLAFWAFGISLVNILPFFVLAYLFSPLNKTVFLIFPPFLMITSVLVVLVSLFTVKHFEIPFKKIANNIESLMLDNDKSKFNTHFLIEEFIYLQEFILKVFDLKEEREAAKKALISLTAQVAHDIRSPLTALNICLRSLPQVPENKRILMRNAADRINDIANNLLQQYSSKNLDTGALPLYLQTWLLAPLLESIISEKRLQFDGRPIELEGIITSDGFSAFARFDPSQMKRLLSNIINNASEAFSAKGGKINLMLDAYDGKVVLKIIDNGCGIAVDLLEKVLDVGVSFKPEGFGLGLPDAKKSIESFGGTLQLYSILKKGTTVEILLPRSVSPDWFVSEIFVCPDIMIGILDDDPSVHDAWNQRLLAVSKNLSIHHFNTIQAFLDWYNLQLRPVHIFSDYELLGESATGLDILENLQLGNKAILVTSHYENPVLIDRCQKAGVRLLPKNLLPHIPIKKVASRIIIND
ncbi:MAG: HAMP domain-containing histidine kinase [Tatlockia sp.]|nr:HAMP domain-containing histidine kinase [Tatlockia sp.]